jgi:hypothetical protein
MKAKAQHVAVSPFDKPLVEAHIRVQVEHGAA